MKQRRKMKNGGHFEILNKHYTSKLIAYETDPNTYMYIVYL